jgi:cytochrome P450
MEPVLRKRIVPRATSHWPLLGALPSLAVNPLEFIRRSGGSRSDLYKTSILGRDVFIVNHPKHVEHIKLSHSDKYLTGEGNPISGYVLPRAVSTSDGRDWRTRRRVVQPYFLRAHLKEIYSMMRDVVQRELASWAMDGHRDDVRELTGLTSHLSINVLMETLFRTTATIAERDAIRRELDYLVGHPLQVTLAAAWSTWMPRRFAVGRPFRARQALREIIGEFLLRREPNAAPGQDLMAHLMEHVSVAGAGEERVLDRDWLVSQMLEIVLAGYETTSTTMSWTLISLMQRPEILTAVHAELDAVLGGRAPEFEDLESFTFLNAFNQEVLRVYPPVYLFWSQCIQDDTIDGYSIPKGSKVIVSVYNVHRHPDVWEDPEQFDPSRFTAEKIRDRPKYAHVPFGFGSRLCLGQMFATLEVQLTLILALQKFRFSLVNPNMPTVPKLGAALRPAGNTSCRILRRV